MRGPRGTRRLALWVVALGVTTMAAACQSASDDAADPSIAPPTTTATQVDQEQAVIDVWEKYWRLRIASENAGRFEKFTGVAEGAAVERHDKRIANYQGEDLVRVGEPLFRDPEVRLDGDAATLTACFNADDWTAIWKGEPYSAEKYGWEDIGSRLERTGTTWLVVEDLAGDALKRLEKSC